MSNTLDFYRAVINSATKNAPPPKHDWFADLCIFAAIAVAVLALVGAVSVVRMMLG